MKNQRNQKIKKGLITIMLCFSMLIGAAVYQEPVKASASIQIQPTPYCSSLSHSLGYCLGYTQPGIRFDNYPGYSLSTSIGYRYDANVQNVQAALSQMGFDPGPIDGYFGSRTKSAVVAWQNKHTGEFTDGHYDIDFFLSPDGIVGPKTWDALSKHSTWGSVGQASVPSDAVEVDKHDHEKIDEPKMPKDFKEELKEQAKDKAQ